MYKWEKHQDPNNTYGAIFTYGNREKELPDTAVISVTRGEQFNLIRILLNSIINAFVKKQLVKNDGLLYAELSGQLDGGIGQTITIWKDRKSMNRFRTNGAHQAARRFFSWVFYSGKVKAYFYTWKANGGDIPSSTEVTKTAIKYGRYYEGGKLIRAAIPSEDHKGDDHDH